LGWEALTLPAPAKTSDAAIVAAAKRIAAAEGLENLSLQAVAEAVGIRTPSLYKRFADRAALVEAVREEVLKSLAERLNKVASKRDPAKALRAMANEYRRFAQREPQLYRLVMASGGEPSPAARAAVAPLFETLSALLGIERALPAARTLTAFLHGFVSMEIGGSFQFAGSVDDAFDFGIRTLLAGLEA
jgi:AcrR family transcriptional regulator